jgi:hypothetical protein
MLFQRLTDKIRLTAKQGYDYLLTFSEELALVWKGNLTGIATILYFITRYLVFFDGVIFLIGELSICGIKILASSQAYRFGIRAI